MFFKKSKKVNDELQQELQKLREENEKLKMCIVDWKGICRDKNDIIEYMFKEEELKTQYITRERNDWTCERNKLTREREAACDCMLMYVSEIEKVKEQYCKYGKNPDFKTLMSLNEVVKNGVKSIRRK